MVQCGLLNNNSSCMSDGKCTKRYPRDLLPETINENDGYPLYRLRSIEDGGKSITLKVFGVENATASIDEIYEYQLGRYISSNEAVWRILSFPIHEQHPTVVHLVVHLENGERVYFTPENARARALPPPLTLIAFFTLCGNDMFAKSLLYSEVPKYYTWNVSAKKFNVANKVKR